MAKVTVPGLKNSTGMKPFEPLDSGRYSFKCMVCKIEPAKTGAPTDVWKFEFQVTKGPEQSSDNRSPKGKKFFSNCNIMRPEHPDFEKYTFGVDELKSMCLAFGVTPKGDVLDPDAFLGLEGEADVIKKLEKNESTGEEVPRNRVNKWIQG